ncbi:MAG: hypothetical protein ACFFCS_05050 [Candidatus Hodarchaeota archaeon]
MAEETRNIEVQCPVCNQKQMFPVPVRLIQDNIKGVSTIAIKAKCGHSFHIFVDKNFSVRGFQRSDFDIKIDTPTAVEKEPIQDLSLPGMTRMFGEDAFIHVLHAMLIGTRAFLLGRDQQILKSLFINFIDLFEREIAGTVAPLEIMSKEEFDSNTPFLYPDDLVIDLDFSVIKRNPFQDNKLKIERELVKECISIQDLDQQKKDMKEKIGRIFLYANVLLNFINTGQKNFKEIKKIMKQKDKNISQKELMLAWDVAQHRYAKHLA